MKGNSNHRGSFSLQVGRKLYQGSAEKPNLGGITIPKSFGGANSGGPFSLGVWAPSRWGSPKNFFFLQKFFMGRRFFGKFS